MSAVLRLSLFLEGRGHSDITSTLNISVDSKMAHLVDHSVATLKPQIDETDLGERVVSRQKALSET